MSVQRQLYCIVTCGKWPESRRAWKGEHVEREGEEREEGRRHQRRDADQAQDHRQEHQVQLEQDYRIRTSII